MPHHRSRSNVLLVGILVTAFTCGLLAQGEVAPQVVRLALVNVPDDVLRPMLPTFNAQGRQRAEIVYTGNDPFAPARNGQADLVIAHYGHAGVQPFVTSGLGRWPQAVFSNQMALIGPSNDPAGVRGLTDASVALGRIAASKSRFLVNNSEGARHLEEVLWTAAGIQPSGDWYLNRQSEAMQAVRDADREGAYVIFGVPPLLRLKARQSIQLEPLVTADPIFQRIMVTVVVNPERVPGVNAAGADAFQRFLLEPETQAAVRAFRYPSFSQQVWWPAGRHNHPQD
jgi:tungstate transport system substrate-binding protein